MAPHGVGASRSNSPLTPSPRASNSSSVAAHSAPLVPSLSRLALCIIGAVRSLALPPVLETLRRNIVDAAEATWVDVFVVLSETDRHAALAAQELLHPVFMLANVQRTVGHVTASSTENICLGAPPLLRTACVDVGAVSMTTRPAHGRLQLWWVARCLTAVQHYEELSAAAYAPAPSRSH
jgi:hypothetical protein